MKKLSSLIALIVLGMGIVKAENLNGKFSSINSTSKESFYAVYITKKTGEFVKTLRLWGSPNNKHMPELKVWPVLSNKNLVDAVTGATVNNANLTNATFSWNGKDSKQIEAPKGEYNLVLEAVRHSNIYNIIRYPITLDGTNKTISPKDTAIWKGVSFSISQTVVNLQSTWATNLSSNYLTIGLNRIELPSTIAGQVSLSLHSLDGKDLGSKILNIHAGKNLFPVEGYNLHPGLYLLKVQSENFTQNSKIYIGN